MHPARLNTAIGRQRPQSKVAEVCGVVYTVCVNMRHLFLRAGGLAIIVSIVLVGTHNDTARALVVTDLTSCRAITTNGSYRLLNAVTSASGPCFPIRNSSVTSLLFDGNGKTITVTDGSAAVEEADVGSGAPSNVTITNVVSTAGIRIYGDNINHSVVQNSIVGSIASVGGDDITISGNTVGAGGIQVNNNNGIWTPYRTAILSNTVTGGSTSVPYLLDVVGGDTHPCPKLDTIISGNTFTDARNDSPTTSTAATNIHCATHTIFTNNVIRSTGTTIGLSLFDEADNGTYENNVFWTNDHPALLMVAGGADKTWPSNNAFHANDFRSDADNVFYLSGMGTENTFTNNTFFANSAYITGYYGGLFGNSWDHNTFYNAGSGSYSFFLKGDYQHGPPADIFTNNIFSYSGNVIYIYDGWDSTRFVGSNNLYQNRAGVVRFGSYGDLEGWKSASGQDDQSIEANPLFTNPSQGDFTLQATSPARDAGVSGGDIGAFTYGTPSPSDCTPLWSCGAWSACLNGQQSRRCTDAHYCKTVLSEPALIQVCGTSAVVDTLAPAAVSNLSAQ